MVEVTKKKGETFESMFRRFTRHIVKSGKIFEAKDRRFCIKERSENSLRTDKLVRLDMSEKRKYLEKIGKIDDRDKRRRRRF